MMNKVYVIFYLSWLKHPEPMGIFDSLDLARFHFADIPEGVYYQEISLNIPTDLEIRNAKPLF